MRLSTIKLAGFKSFVDPTVLRLPSDLVGIVGPNGCGKSNLIDAVRWVMGESSARSLRGETMSDVIFNGSASRKPVGQASIELVFDNSQGRLGGSWASYAEIAIRRLLGRDGQSSYFLNGTRCRRRDIADLFLGTGLGSRSYAIIEQGMISRVVEARPDELRVFLEEAAGISRYKDRRRETEMRIQHTRDNLDRLNDVREELSRQLQHLQRQARAAEQYRELRAAERRLQAELLSVRWRDLQTEIADRDRELRQRETTLAAALAEQRRLEADLEVGHARRLEANKALNSIQEQYYEAGAEISRVEQFLQHQRELRRRRADARRQLTTARSQIEAQWDADQRQRDELATALVGAEPEQQRALAVAAAAAQALAAAEGGLRDAQAAWEASGRHQAELQRQVEVERTHLLHSERRLAQDQERLQRLRREAAMLDESAGAHESAALDTAERTAAASLHQTQEALASVESDLAATGAAQGSISQLARAVRERLQIGRGRLAALQTLQEAALGRQAGALRPWLAARGLAETPRLAERLEVEPGWESAVEAALSGWMDALCVPALDALGSAVAEFQQGRLTLLEWSPPASNRPEMSADPAIMVLAAKVRASWPLEWLDSVRVVASVDEALAQRHGLRPGEALVTPEGVVCGRHWLRLLRGSDDGVLARERDMRQLDMALREEAATLDQAVAESERLRERQRALEQQRRTVQQAVNEGHRAHAAAQGRLQAAQAQAEQARTRRAGLEAESAALATQGAQEQERIAQAGMRLREASAALRRLEQGQVALDTQRAQAQTALRSCQEQADGSRQDASHWTLVVETSRARLTATEQALMRLAAQQTQLVAQEEQWAAESAADADAALATAEKDLAIHLERRLALDGRLQAARETLHAQDAAVQANQQAHGRCQRQVEAWRGELEQWRLGTSEARLRQQNLQNQIYELGGEPEALLAALPPTATESDRLAQLQNLERRLQRLGAINLAAIEECAQVAERKQYLDVQNDDLARALATLESAIQQMDRETRSRFRDTFERVNAGLEALFPRLFGGGQAHLELVGVDTLDAGVMIMAKPPGKRIGSISLLSGGEKALTAIALVFAFFQLNPAPFCLLDEVDAPLDEANIDRFGAVVREMAARVQFIFITHNKATMEIAQHLVGVTMQEAGVSRLVTVDVEAAVRLAAVA